jgi:hypothetical protein
MGQNNQPKPGTNAGNNSEKSQAELPLTEKEIHDNSFTGQIVINDKDGKPVTITLEQLRQIQESLGPRVIQVAEQHNRVAEKTTESTNPELQYRVEDYLDEPVVFFSLRREFIDYGCFNHKTGRYHIPPFRDEGKNKNENGEYPVKPIHFRFSYAEKVANYKLGEFNDIPFCTYFCKNQKELDYLLNHPKLGIEFFRAKNEITTTDTIRGRALADAANEVDVLRNDSVVERLQNLGKEVSTDMGQNRNQLIAVLADERLKQEDKIMANNAMLSSDGKRKAIFEMGSNKPAVHERV